MQSSKRKESCIKVFFLAFALSAAVFIPYIIAEHGYFFLYADYNMQQIPFGVLAQEAVRSGEFFWNWSTDLGANFIGSYSFYNLGSPFFWLTTLFPEGAVPYLLAPLLMLKVSLAAVAAYAFLRRYVKDSTFAVMSAILYALSSFSVYNLFYNHFHEAILLFPLLMLALDLLVEEGRTGVFALVVLAAALNNYYFFFGMVLFTLIYVLVRTACGGWSMRPGRFCKLCLEAALGFGMSMVLMLPAVLSVLQNQRISETISGVSCLVYDWPMYAELIKSMLCPPDLPDASVFFAMADVYWRVPCLWLPLVGLTGVLGYFTLREPSWLKTLLIVCGVIVFVPVLNSMFSMFNAYYYSRWFFMPILFLCMATGISFSRARQANLKSPAVFIMILLAFIVGITALWPNEYEGRWQLGIYDHTRTLNFFYTAGVALLCAGLTLWLVYGLYRRPERYRRLLLIFTAAVSVLYASGFLYTEKSNFEYDTDAFMIPRAVNGAEKIDLPGDEEHRIDILNSLKNLSMYWDMPCIQGFHSIVPGSVTNFYDFIGMERVVEIHPDTSHYTLRGLLSVKWVFEEEGYRPRAEADYLGQAGELPGFSYYDTQNGFQVYENEAFLPYGFTYEYYLTRSEAEALSPKERERVMIKAMVVPDEEKDKAAAVLMHYDASEAASLGAEEYLEECTKRSASSAGCFQRDTRGFTAEITLEAPNYVFFSVPYESGWSAEVNGEPAEILFANELGMAVKCSAGVSDIRFTYMTPGLKTGGYITLSCFGVFLLYLAVCGLIFLKRRGKSAKAEPGAPEIVDGFTVNEEIFAELCEIEEKHRPNRKKYGKEKGKR